MRCLYFLKRKSDSKFVPVFGFRTEKNGVWGLEFLIWDAKHISFAWLPSNDLEYVAHDGITE